LRHATATSSGLSRSFDRPLLYVYSKDEEIAAEIEDDYALHISIVASRIVGQEVEVVVVMPKVVQ
jgi:hypothetical protein